MTPDGTLYLFGQADAIRRFRQDLGVDRRDRRVLDVVTRDAGGRMRGRQLHVGDDVVILYPRPEGRDAVALGQVLTFLLASREPSFASLGVRDHGWLLTLRPGYGADLAVRSLLDLLWPREAMEFTSRGLYSPDPILDRLVPPEIPPVPDVWLAERASAWHEQGEPDLEVGRRDWRRFFDEELPAQLAMMAPLEMSDAEPVVYVEDGAPETCWKCRNRVASGPAGLCRLCRNALADDKVDAS